MTATGEPLQRLVIGEAPRVLEAVLHPVAAPRGGVVVCHPHPQYGGDMDNAVVQVVATHLAAAGWTALRFNFGGVGDSGGAYSGGTAEVTDVAAAARALRARLGDGLPLAVAGYSFGAWVALRAASGGVAMDRVVAIAPPLDLYGSEMLAHVPVPVGIVVGAADPFCTATRIPDGPAAVRVLPGADHFLHGVEGVVARAVVEFLA